MESSFYGLQKIGGGGMPFSTNDYAFSVANVDVIDRLLAKINNNIFDMTPAIASPTSGLSLTANTTGGSIAAGKTLRYKFAYVDAYGNETAASPETSISTTAGPQPPQAPTISSSTSGGTLSLGRYFYVLSAYVTADTSESIAINRAFIVLPTGTANAITLILPSVPSGAGGFNVYKKGPGQSQFFWIASIDMTVVTPPTTFIDDGSYDQNTTRTPVTTATSNSTNSVTITVPNGVVPSGYTWKVYRTYTPGNYNTSLLAWVVTESSPGVIDPSYVDTGTSPMIGTPPERNLTYGDLLPGLGATPEAAGCCWIEHFYEDFEFEDVATPNEDLGEFTVVDDSDEATPVNFVEQVYSPGDGFKNSDGYLSVDRGSTDPAYVEKLYTIDDGDMVAYGFAVNLDAASLNSGDIISLCSINNSVSKPGAYDAIEFVVHNNPAKGVGQELWPELYVYIDGALDSNPTVDIPFTSGWHEVRIEVDWTNSNYIEDGVEPANVRCYIDGAFVMEGVAPHYDEMPLDAVWWGQVQTDVATEVWYDSFYIEQAEHVRLDPTTTTLRYLQNHVDPLPTQYGRRHSAFWYTDIPTANEDRTSTTYYDDVQFRQISELRPGVIYKMEGFLLVEAADNEDIKFKIRPLNSHDSSVVKTRYTVQPSGLVVAGNDGQVYQENEEVVMNIGGLAYPVAIHIVGLIDTQAESHVCEFHFHWAQNASTATPGGTSILAGSWFRITK